MKKISLKEADFALNMASPREFRKNIFYNVKCLTCLIQYLVNCPFSAISCISFIVFWWQFLNKVGDLWWQSFLLFWDLWQ